MTMEDEGPWRHGRVAKERSVLKMILTNDDGIESPGIEAMEKVLRDWGTPIVVAPEAVQSGVGHQVTTHSPIRVDELGRHRFRVAGTPADCTRIALTLIAPDAAWVFAGINRGGNLGADVYTSGTVAAAREATLLGCPAIAFSQYVARNRDVDWKLTARRVVPLLRMLMARELGPGHFWNVNLPHPPGDRTHLKVVFCALDTRPHGVRYQREGQYLIYAGDYHQRPRQRGRDVDVCLSGKVAVSRIALEMTCLPRLPSEG
jgi:5'-nucleotidase